VRCVAVLLLTVGVYNEYSSEILGASAILLRISLAICSAMFVKSVILDSSTSLLVAVSAVAAVAAVAAVVASELLRIS